MLELKLSKFAESELGAIWDYIAIDNINAADRFTKAAFATMEKLVRFPELGRIRNFGNRSCAIYDPIALAASKTI